MHSRTGRVIAHRLGTVRHADEIIVLQFRKIVERGNHHELMVKRILDTGFWILKPLMHSRTGLVIAHRLGTVRHADEISVLQFGKIVERGNHPDLMIKGGFLKRLLICRK